MKSLLTVEPPAQEAADARKLIRPLRAELKRLLRSLIHTQSVAIPPSGNETRAQRVLHSFLRFHGLRPEIYDTGFLEKANHPLVRKNRNYRGRSNVAAQLAGTGGGKSLLLSGHMDTVPPGPDFATRWARSPWSGSPTGSHIHGLGSFDMKGGLVAQAAVLFALHRARIRPAGDLLFESVVDEEYGGGGGTIAARLHSGNADACIIAEGTQLEVYRATRGGFVVDLSVGAGDPASYFSKAEVVSPAIPMGRLLGWVERQAHARATVQPTGIYRTFPDPVPVQVLAAESGTFHREAPLSVPSQAAVRVYFQFLPEEDVDAAIEAIRNDLQHFCAADPFFSQHPVGWHALIGGPLYGHELPADHALTTTLAAAATGVLGRPAVVTAAPYPCDAGLMHRDFGIPTALFGPIGAGAHNADEWVDFESVIQSAEVLLATALRWCS
jgi:acetylornithine deacetylase